MISLKYFFKRNKKFFKDLVMAPSPSGFEQPAQEVFRNYIKEYADEVMSGKFKAK